MHKVKKSDLFSSLLSRVHATHAYILSSFIPIAIGIITSMGTDGTLDSLYHITCVHTYIKMFKLQSINVYGTLL